MKKIDVETWPIEKLVSYARILRRNDDAVDRMVAAIREFGLLLPLLIGGDGEIVDGHLRLKAAWKMQLAEVKVILCDDWTPAQVKAFRLAVNRSATWAQWDWTRLALEIAELQNLNFDLALTGFDPLEIDKLLLQFREPGSGGLQHVLGRCTEQIRAAWVVGGIAQRCMEFILCRPATFSDCPRFPVNSGMFLGRRFRSAGASGPPASFVFGLGSGRPRCCAADFIVVQMRPRIFRRLTTYWQPTVLKTAFVAAKGTNGKDRS